MDGKKSETKKSIKQLFGEYIGMYFENLPKTKDELIDNLPELIKKAGYVVGNIILGYLFGSMALAYSAIPLGTAYLCSAKKYVGFIYLGLAISAATEKTGLAIPLFLIYTALYLARLLVYRTFGREENSFEVFGESVGYRLIEGFSASLLISVYRAASFGFLYYDLFGGLFEVATVPIFIYLYEFWFNDKYKYSIKREIGLITLLCAILLAIKDTYVYGFGLCLTVTAILTLYISKNAGAMRGGIYGLVFGFICNTALSPVMALVGMAAGVLWRIGAAAAISVACFVGIVCSIYVDGWNSLTLYAPELLCAGILFFPFARFSWLPKLKIYSDGLNPTDDADISAMLAEKRQRDTEKRFEDLSEAFSDLSKVFYTLSDRIRRPGLIDTRKICDEVCDKYCPKCFYRNICWEREYSSTQDVFSKIAKGLHNKGYVESSDVEEYMRERCRNINNIIEKINDGHAELLEKLIRQNRTEVFAMDYEAMAHLLSAEVKANYSEFLPRDSIKKKLAEAIKYMKFSARNICVYGKRKLTVVANGVELAAMKLSANEITECFENICEVKFDTPTFEVEGDYVTMTLESARRFSVECAASSNTKENEKMCGDLVCMFENGNDYFYSLISDGMGSGREAALTSRLCGIFLKKMLAAGNSKPVAMEMLNNFIRSKNTECFSTVDLLEIDLLNGYASFIKSGAVASFVLRGDKLFRIASNTMPVGITKEINAEEVKFELKDGDVIVMVSDGVGQSTQDTVRVSNILTYSWEDDLKKMADKILYNALENSTRSDDISVGIIRVNEI